MNDDRIQGNKISKAKLLLLIPKGTKLTLVYTTFRGKACKRRTVLKATSHQVIMMIDEEGPKFGESTYLNFNTGDQFFADEHGFTVLSAEGGVVGYNFGHREPEAT